MAQTIAERILARSAGRKSVKPGEIVDAKVDVAMAHEACAQVVPPFEKMGAKRVWDPTRVVIPLDHWVPATSEAAAALHKTIRGFVAKYKLPHFFDVGRHGICHQMLAEYGFVFPGDICLGTDSHTTTLGALGAFATGVGPTEMAAVFATGHLWLRVPESILVDVKGRLPAFVSGKDLILAVMGKLGVEGALYRALEFSGNTVRGLDISDRLTLCNMVIEAGAKTGIVAPDGKTVRYLSKNHNRCTCARCRTLTPERAGRCAEEFYSDADAAYSSRLDIDASSLVPMAAIPPSPDNVKPVAELKGTKIHQVFFGSCTNGRIEDIRIVARMLRGKQVHPAIRLIVNPASTNIYRQALKEGLISMLIDAGAAVETAGCGACFGGSTGILAQGESCASTSNRNFIGRMGSRESRVYLVSPATAAATALTGELTDPREL